MDRAKVRVPRKKNTRKATRRAIDGKLPESSFLESARRRLDEELKRLGVAPGHRFLLPAGFFSSSGDDSATTTIAFPNSSRPEKKPRGRPGTSQAQDIVEAVARCIAEGCPYAPLASTFRPDISPEKAKHYLRRRVSALRAKIYAAVQRYKENHVTLK